MIEVGKNLLATLLIILIVLMIMKWYEEVTNKKLPKEMPPIMLVALVSFLWLLLVFNLWLSQEESLALNNWGDFLAGFFAPVLFLWVVFGIFIQKEELGNALEALQTQQKELSNSVNAQNQQVVQIEIQQLNTWFNRNIATLNTLKNEIMKEGKSLQQISTELENDISINKTYFDLFDEVKNLIDLDNYILGYLNDIELREVDKPSLSISIQEIKSEYSVLFEIDMIYAKRILTIVYFLIFASQSTSSVYKDYNVYYEWIKNKEDYQNLLVKYNIGTFENTLKEIMKNFKKFEIDFKTGKLHGNI